MAGKFCYLDAYERAVALRRPMPLLHRPLSGTAITLFDLIQLGGMIGGTWVGFTIGSRGFGGTGTVTGGILGLIVGHFLGITPWCPSWAVLGAVTAVTGGILGLIVGHFLGITPWYLCWGVITLQIKLTTTEGLRKKLQTEHYMSDRFIAEMIVRGEPVKSFWPYILSSLRSDSFYERYHGWVNLNIWFPRIAKQIEGFSPEDSMEWCRKYITKIENAEPNAAPLSPESAIGQSDHERRV
jgi:hypothetical protein